MPTRRTVLTTGAAFALGAAAPLPTAPLPTAPLLTVRLGILPFGSVHWVANVIRRHGLDTANGFALATVPLAGSDAARVALLSRSVDVAVSDWPFVAAQRLRGSRLCFAPFSNAAGGIMVPGGSSVRALADLKGLRLGVAGGPADKSWLIVQAAARRQGITLATASTLSYGAPPLLGGLLQKGTLDAVLTFWPNAARLEAQGFRQAIAVSDCASALGLPASPDLVGYVFDQDWAAANHPGVDGFLAAATAACDLLRTGDAEWRAVRPVMDAPDDGVFGRLRARFVVGMNRPDAAAELRQAAVVAPLIGAPTPLPPGVFWPTRQGPGGHAG